MDIRTSDAAFHALWSAINETRDTTAVVKVDKKMLKDLLNDHSDLTSKVEKIVPLRIAA